jgi:hypothetical protein
MQGVSVLARRLVTGGELIDEFFSDGTPLPVSV